MENKIIKAGTKIVIGMDAGMAGTDAIEAYELLSDYTEDQLSDIAWARGLDHAELYGVYPLSDLEAMSEEDLVDVDEDDYNDNIEGWWELYDAEKHDAQCMRGYDTEVHFNKLY